MSGIFCFPARLVGGPYPNEGRVEINFMSEWGSICANGFDLSDGDVVCRMVGYTNAVVIKSQQKSQTAWLKDVSCQGSENNIENCTHSGFARQTCPNDKIVEVTCNNGK